MPKKKKKATQAPTDQRAGLTGGGTGFDLTAEDAEAYQRLMRTPAGPFLTLFTAQLRNGSAETKEKRKAAFVFCLHQLLWRSEPQNEAAGFKALKAWLLVYTHCRHQHDVPVNVTPQFLVYSLRVLCGFSRQSTPLAIKLDLEKHPERKLEEDELIRIGQCVVEWSFILLLQPGMAQGFVAAGGWDVIVHLLLYPPPDALFHKRPGAGAADGGAESKTEGGSAEGTLVSLWWNLWGALANAADHDKSAIQAFRNLFKAPADPEYKFPYSFAGTTAAGPASAVPLMKPASRAALLCDVAAVTMLEGDITEADRAAGFFDTYDKELPIAQSKQLRKQTLSGHFAVRLRDRLLALRSHSLNTPGGLAEEKLSGKEREERLEDLHTLAMRLAELLVAAAAVKPSKVEAIMTPDVYNALIAHSLAMNERLEVFGARLWPFPSCFHPACTKHRSLRETAAAIPPVPGYLLGYLLGAFFRIWANRRDCDPEDREALLQQGHELSTVGYGVLLETHKCTPAVISPDLMTISTVPTPESVRRRQRAQTGPGTESEFDMTTEYHEGTWHIVSAWGRGFGINPVFLSREFVTRDRRMPDLSGPAPLPSSCASPACGKEAKMRCGGCKRARYCSKKCQQDHRPAHAEACKALAKAAGTGAGAGA